jgi:hypothetical protein
MTIRKTLAAGLAATALLAVPAFAKVHRDKCEQKYRKAEANLQQAIRKHGERSRQAEQKREQLERVRATCHR